MLFRKNYISFDMGQDKVYIVLIDIIDFITQ